MILIHMTSIKKMLNSTQGQSYKIKGQGLICKFVEKKRVSTIYYEPMIGY